MRPSLLPLVSALLTATAAGGTGGPDCNGNGVLDVEETRDLSVFLDFDGGGTDPAHHSTGMWHVTGGCQPGGSCGATSLFCYFGKNSTCDHQTASAVQGTFTLQDVRVPASATLTFCEAFASECCDFGEVRVDGELVLYNCCGEASPSWVQREIDLADWAGQTVDITWSFETIDALSNEYYGWAIDDLRVEGHAANDCDANSVPDECDIAAGALPDFDGDGACDTCQPHVGEAYCDSNPNSTGVPSTLFAIGSESLAANDLALVSVDLPAGYIGYYLMSANQGFVPFFGGSAGNLCLGSPLLRFNHLPGALLHSNEGGFAGYVVDNGHLPHGVAFLPGERWNFQLWHRDADHASNTTNGLAVTFQ